MGAMPDDVADLLDKALVCELTVVDECGRLHTDPLIPLWDGSRILMTSSILFSRKLERIKANPRVCVSLSDPVGIPREPFLRATIQGDARILDGDLHRDWYRRTFDLWIEKEPVVRKLLRFRFALPLFWERSVIEIEPRRVIRWYDGDTTRRPDVFELEAAS